MLKHFTNSSTVFLKYLQKNQKTQYFTSFRSQHLIKKQRMEISKMPINIMQQVVNNIYGSNFLLNYLKQKFKFVK